MSQLTFGSLFAGIGGFDLGFERAGMVCKWQVEIDQFCQKVLAKHWPNVQRYSDVKEVGQHNLEPVDVICGGFPCQPHSQAGKRQASADDRDLWGEFKRIVSQIKPQWVVAENVPGLLTSENGRFFGGVLRDLAEIGYDAEWYSLQAAQFGAPHIRQRVFILAYPQSVGQNIIREGWSSAENGRYAITNRGWVKAKWCSDRVSFDLASRHSIGGMWQPQPGVFRVLDGVPCWLDRLHSVGNAVMPQIAEFIAELIIRQANKRMQATP